MSKFNDFLNEQLQDPEVRAEYEALEPEFSIMQAMIGFPPFRSSWSQARA